jgi:signal transduction histidine kinase
MGSGINLILGLAEILLALVVLARLGRLGRSFPWLVALAIFFIARGIDRVYVGALGREPVIAPVIVDAVLLAVVALLLVGMQRTVLALRRSIDDADWQKSEYERALRDYRSLVRHRLANPLTVVLAGVEMLRHSAAPRSDYERAILEDVYLGVRRLKQISIDPEPLSDEEKQLDGTPRFPARQS